MIILVEAKSSVRKGGICDDEVACQEKASTGRGLRGSRTGGRRVLGQEAEGEALWVDGAGQAEGGGCEHGRAQAAGNQCVIQGMIWVQRRERRDTGAKMGAVGGRTRCKGYGEKAPSIYTLDRPNVTDA